MICERIFKAQLCGSIFIHLWKMCKDEVMLATLWREFHRVGYHYREGLLPDTCQVCISMWQPARETLPSWFHVWAGSWQSLAKGAGNLVLSTLHWARKRTSSQCDSPNAEVIHWNLLVSKYKRVATFWTSWNFLWHLQGQPPHMLHYNNQAWE